MLILLPITLVVFAILYVNVSKNENMEWNHRNDLIFRFSMLSVIAAILFIFCFCFFMGHLFYVNDFAKKYDSYTMTKHYVNNIPMLSIDYENGKFDVPYGNQISPNYVFVKVEQDKDIAIFTERIYPTTMAKIVYPFAKEYTRYTIQYTESMLID